MEEPKSSGVALYLQVWPEGSFMLSLTQVRVHIQAFHPKSMHPTSNICPSSNILPSIIIQQTIHQLSTSIHHAVFIWFRRDIFKNKNRFSFFVNLSILFFHLDYNKLWKMFSKSWYIFHCWLDLANIKFSRWDMFLLHTFNTLTMPPPAPHPLSPPFINHLTHATSPTNTQQNTSQGWRSN